MMQVLQMTVNGRPVEVGVDPRESLLDTLRNRLGLTSVKRGCEVGECGACTVLVDGKAIDSCIYLSVWAQGKAILTVEGLQAPDGTLSPIQRAFVEEAADRAAVLVPHPHGGERFFVPSCISHGRRVRRFGSQRKGGLFHCDGVRLHCRRHSDDALSGRQARSAAHHSLPALYFMQRKTSRLSYARGVLF